MKGIGMYPVFFLPFHHSASLSLSPIFVSLRLSSVPVYFGADADIPLAGFTASLRKHAEPLFRQSPPEVCTSTLLSPLM